MSRFIYVPIEIKSREYVAKLILATRLANLGYSVIVGKSTEVEKLCLFGPAGIYLGTSIMKQHNALFERIIKSGSKVIAADEEGLVYYNEEDFVRNKIYYPSLKNIEYFLTWGEHHRTLVKKKYPEIQDKIKCIGNIRMELLKPKYRFLYQEKVASIKQRHSKFILFNTNFGAYNNYKDSQNYLDIAKNISGGDTSDEIFRREKIEHQRVLFEAFVNLAIKLKIIYPELNIIIRPHPSENVENWRVRFEGTNVEVIRDGDVIPWILASECIIQQNCTTAIEALCLDQKVFSYIPLVDKRFDDGLPNKVVPVFTDEGELIKSIAKVLVMPEEYNEILKKNRLEDLDKYISSLGKDEDVFDAYRGVFDLVDTDDIKINESVLRTKFKVYNAISMLLNRKKRKMQGYFAEKYPHTPISELKKIIDDIDKSNGTYCTKLHFVQLSNEAYIIRK